MKEFVTHANKSCEVWIRAYFVLANMQENTDGMGLLVASCKIGLLCAAPVGIFASFLAVVLHAEEQHLLSKCLLKLGIVTSTSKSVVCPKSQSRQLSDREWSLVLPVLHYLQAALLSQTPMGTSSSQDCTFFSFQKSKRKIRPETLLITGTRISKLEA